MKKVIRRGVFETNSSSSHSYTITRNDNCKTVEKGASFEIKSKVAKTVWLLGIIDCSLELYERNLSEESYDKELKYVRKKLLEEIEKCEKIDMKLMLEELGDINEFSVTELVYYVLAQYAGIDEKDAILNKIENGYDIYSKEFPINVHDVYSDYNFNPSPQI